MSTPADPEQGQAQVGAPAAPFLRVVRGNATPEEIAALVAVLASTGAPAAEPRADRPAWNHPARGVRTPLAHGPGGWRTSGLPR